MSKWERFKKSNLVWVIGFIASAATLVNIIWPIINEKVLENNEQIHDKFTTNIKNNKSRDSIKIAEIKSDDALAWHNKGVDLSALGRKDEALQAYNKAIEIKPDYALAWHNKGFILSALGRKDEALQAYDKAIEIKPDHVVWYNKGVALSALGRKKEAQKAFDKAKEIQQRTK